jgi:PKD domain/HYR domain
MKTHSAHSAGRLLGRLLLLLGMIATLGLMTGGLVTPAHAATLTVTDCSGDNGPGQIGTVINSASAGDTITFSCSGDIPLTSTLTISKNLTLDGSGQSVTLDGGGSVQVLSVNSGVTFTLNALTIAHGSDSSVGGGGLYNNGGTVSITNSTFANNSASGGNASEGGGLFNNRGTVSITNSTFASNSASGGSGAGGGGLQNHCGIVNITNSTFANNSGIGGGGGLANDCGAVSITSSTFASNSAIRGGGIYNLDGLSIGGSIVAENTGGDCIPGVDITGITDQGYNLDSDSSCFSASTSLHTNPQLAGLTSNGGPTQTMALQQGSPAIDAVASSANICPSTDQRGNTRPDDASETACDMGAYESVAAQPLDNDLALTSVPANITVNATSTQGAVVTYTPPTVVDEDNPLPPVNCSPAPGSTFAIGTTTVTCTVSDSDDTNSPVSQSFTVTVNPSLSVSVHSVNATEGSAFSGLVATGTAYGSSTPLSATITWGDGNSSTVNVTPNPDGSYSVPGSHTYAEEGSYALAVSIKDSSSLSASGKGSAKVADAALTLTQFVAGPLAHRSAGLAATFTDADPAGAVSDYTATINWGDGNTSTVKAYKNPRGKGFVLAGLHQYASKGTYTVTLTVTDQGGSQVSKTVTLAVK